MKEAWDLWEMRNVYKSLVKSSKIKDNNDEHQNLERVISKCHYALYQMPVEVKNTLNGNLVCIPRGRGWQKCFSILLLEIKWLWWSKCNIDGSGWPKRQCHTIEEIKQQKKMEKMNQSKDN